MQVFSCELWKAFKNTYFEEILQVAVNNDSKWYNYNLFPKNKPPVPTGTWKDNSWSIRQLSCSCTSEYTFIFTWPVLNNQIPNLLRSNYKSSLHIRTGAPSKKLTSSHVDVHIEVRNSAVSRICEQIKEVVWARNPFHLTVV